MNPAQLPWRTGRKVGRTIYAVEDTHTLAGPLIGVMDTPELAQAAVEAHNQAHFPGIPPGPFRPDPVIPEDRGARLRWWKR